MMLPVKVEVLEDLKARFGKALEPIIDASHGVPNPTPGEQRQHVFDCEDGLRVIASRDRMSDGKIYYHFSVSFHVGSLIQARVQAGRIGVPEVRRIAEKRFNELTGLNVRPADRFLLSTGKAIPHWIWKEQYPEETTERNLS